jgi:hypothetical protein
MQLELLLQELMAKRGKGGELPLPEQGGGMNMPPAGDEELLPAEEAAPEAPPIELSQLDLQGGGGAPNPLQMDDPSAGAGGQMDPTQLEELLQLLMQLRGGNMAQ